MKKKIFLILNLIAIAFTVSAQAPNAIPYQGVARNAAGNILASQPISLRVSIHDATANGAVVFSETHSAATSSLGLFNVNIGQGNPLTGTLATVDWANGAKFMQVEFDPAGGASYSDMGTTQLNSVPYALYAGSSGTSGQWATTGNDIYNSNSGNIGIGTTTPSSRLTVVQPFASGVELLSGSDAQWTALAIGRAGTEMNMAVANAPGNFINGTQAGDVVIRVNDDTKKIVISPWVTTPTMVVTGTAVGIGNPTPAANLDVVGNVKIADGTQGAGKVLTSDANGVASWQTASSGGIETDPEVNNTITNQVAKWNGVSLVDGSITDDGSKIGIGNASPLYKLDVAGESGVSSRMKGNLILDGSEGTFGSGWIGFRNTTSGLEWDVEGAADFFTIGRSGVGYDVSIASNGNVGIGTGNAAPPAAKLEVAGNVKIADGTQGAGKILTSDANGVATWQTAPSAGAETDPEVSNTITNQVAKWNGVSLVDGLITDDGTNVGIGTIAPSSKLTVVKALGSAVELLSGSDFDWTALAIGRASTEMNIAVANAPGNFINGTQAGDVVIRVNDDTKKIVISPWVTTPTMVVTGTSVGIGNPIPAANLDVVGNVKITDGTQGAGKVLTSDANGVASWQTASSGGTETDPEVSNTITNQVAKWNGVSLVDGLITDDGTNVGIGTVAPSSKLTVVKALGSAVELLSGSDFDWTALAIGRASTEMNMAVANAPGNFINGTQAGDVVIRVNDDTKKIVISPWVTTPTMVVTGTSVGIGNPTPAANLDVVGNVKIADGTQGAGKVLTSDANGVASWAGTSSFVKAVNNDLNPSGFELANINNNQMIYEDHSITVSANLAAGFSCDYIYHSLNSGTVSAASAILFEKNSNTAVSSINIVAGAHIRIQAVDATHVFVTVY